MEVNTISKAKAIITKYLKEEETTSGFSIIAVRDLKDKWEIKTRECFSPSGEYVRTAYYIPKDYKGKIYNKFGIVLNN